MKTALITGATGRDGSCLAELLLEKDYEDHGIKRRASSLNTSRIDHLQQDKPDDYVIATGEQYSVREFIELGDAELDMDIEWQGSGDDEVGINRVTGNKIVAVDPRHFRPTKVETLLGDPSKAKRQLG